MREERPFKPSILDKLVAHLGRSKGDGSRDTLPCYIAAVDPFSELELRNVVMRDIAWIINDIHFGAAISLADYPEIATSVLNQGVSDLSAIQISSQSLQQRARDIGEAIRAFEPRLVASSLTVRFDTSDIINENKVRFIINGELRGAIDDRYVELKAAVAIDSGDVDVEA